MSDHARLSASAAHRWMNCPGSVNLSDGLPNTSSAYAVEGTFAHNIAATCLNTGDNPARYLEAKHKEDGHTVECDQEMVDGVQLYLDVCNADAQPGDKIWIEMQLDALKKLHPDFGGTADCVRYRPSTRHLLTTDFKYGAGVMVEPESNKQLMVYALGALLQIKIPVIEVTVRIVQPRIEYEDERVRDWTFKAVDLLDFAADMIDAAKRTYESDAPLVPGKEQCRWCLARRICPALETAQNAIIAAEFASIATYDPQKLADALNLIPMVEARIKALREFAYTEAMRGSPPPGFKLVDKRATRRWLNDANVIEWSQAKAVDPYAPRELKSPAQLEKLLKKPEKEEVKQFIESKSSGVTLVPATDDRPAAKLLTADDFSAAPTTGVVKLF